METAIAPQQDRFSSKLIAPWWHLRAIDPRKVRRSHCEERIASERLQKKGNVFIFRIVGHDQFRFVTREFPEAGFVVGYIRRIANLLRGGPAGVRQLLQNA